MTAEKFRNMLSRRVVPAFLLLSGLALLALGIPRFMHELMLVPGTPVYQRLIERKAVTDEDLTVLERSRLQALGYSEKADAWSELGTVYLARARRADEADTRQAFARQAIGVLEKSVAIMPLDTASWAKLVSANLMLGEERYDDALIAWRYSVDTAPFEPLQQPSRIHSGILLYDVMTPEDITTLQDQLQSVYTWNERHICRYMRDNRLLEWAVFLSPEGSDMAAYFTLGKCT